MLSQPPFLVDTTNAIVEDEILRPLELMFDDQFITVSAIEQIDEFQSHRIDLNAASIEDLAVIPGLSRSDAEAFIVWRNEHGQIRRFDQLEEIKGLSLSGREMLRRFGSIRAARLPGWLSSRSRTGSSLDEASISLRSLGMYQRMRLSVNDRVDVVALTAKDAGEPYVTDFASASVTLRHIGFIRELVVGDFVANIGQGLVSWREGIFLKSAELNAALRTSMPVLQPFGSSVESGFYRGVGLEAEFGPLRMLLLGSSHAFDASLDSLGRITRFVTDGYHRTASELERRLNSRENVFGVSAAYYAGNLTQTDGKIMERSHVRASLFVVGYDRDVMMNSLPPFRRAVTGSLAGEWHMSAASLVGELAWSAGGYPAQLIGFQARVAKSFDFLLLARNYSAKFFSPHGYAFGEGGDLVNNERGVFAGLRWLAGKDLELSTYVDYFRFPYPTGTVSFPQNGAEIFAQVLWRIADQTVVSVRFRSRSIDQMEKITDAFGRSRAVTTIFHNRNARVLLTANPAARIGVTSWVATVWTYDDALRHAEKGWLFVEDVSWRIHVRALLHFRLLFFRTDSYDSRLYEYEPSVAGTFDLPPLYGRGKRWFVIASYAPFSWLRISGKLSETVDDAGTRSGRGTLQVDIQF